MSAKAVDIVLSRRGFKERRVFARTLIAFVLLSLGSIACGLLETPEPTPSATPSRPTSEVAPTLRPTSTLDTVAPTAPSGGGLVLQVSVAPVPENLPKYDRDEWRHWTDEDSDCQNARQEVLIAESTVAVTFKSPEECRVASGRWLGPYTGEVVTDPGKLDIDHLVPLENAHRSGAWAWDKQRKRDFANYIGYDNHLLATTSSANRSKGSKGPENWRPPLESYWCAYAIDWITVKNSWGLTVTEAEFGALREMLAACNAPALLQRTGEGSPPVPTAVAAPAPATPTVSAPAATETPTPTAAVEPPTPRPTVPPGLKYDPYGPDRDCGDFDTYEEALEFYLAAGGPAEDPHNLDANGDGKPCDSLPRSRFSGQSVVAPASGISAPFVAVAFSPGASQTLPIPTLMPAPTPSPAPTVVPAPAPTATPAPEPVLSPPPPSTSSPTATPVVAPTASPTPEPAPTLAPSAELPVVEEFPGVVHDPAGPDRNCSDFDSWWDAQNFYQAAGGPESDPHRLDGNGDGVVCESLRNTSGNPSEPSLLELQTTPVSESVQSEPETTPAEDDSGIVDLDCRDFDTWQQAQDFFLSQGGPGNDRHGLDRDGDGIACQSLRNESPDSPGQAAVERSPTDAASDDRNCSDFDSWQEAQDFFLSEGGPANDPHRLDNNGDGIACESLPGAP